MLDDGESRGHVPDHRSAGDPEAAAGDEVTVQGHIIGIRDRTQIRIFDQGVEPPMDLTGAFLLHTARTSASSAAGSTRSSASARRRARGWCASPSRSGAQYGVRAICGKGGFPDEAIEPMQRLGMVYFAIVGGAAALETTQIEEIEEVGLGGADARVPLEVPRQGLRPADGRDRRARQLALPRRPDQGQGETGGALCPPLTHGFLDLPARPGKPRAEGLTHVIDKGLNLREIEGLFDIGGEFVDIVKFGWGTSYMTNNLEKKIALFRSFETPVVCGGTLFEVVYVRGRMDEFKRWLIEHRFAHVEISDGTIDIPRERKLEHIADFARDFTVLSEVGSKDTEVVFAPYQWVEWIKEEIEAGAWKVITEGREGGTAGIFRKDGDMRTGLIDEIAHEIALDDITSQGEDCFEWSLIERISGYYRIGKITANHIPHGLKQ